MLGGNHVSTICRQPELLPGLTHLLLPHRRCFSLLATLAAAYNPWKGHEVYFTRQAIHKLEAFEEGCR